MSNLCRLPEAALISVGDDKGANQALGSNIEQAWGWDSVRPQVGLCTKVYERLQMLPKSRVGLLRLPALPGSQDVLVQSQCDLLGACESAAAT